MPKPNVKKPPAKPAPPPLPRVLQVALDIVRPMAALSRTPMLDNQVKLLLRWGESLAKEFVMEGSVYSGTVDDYAKTVNEWWDYVQQKPKKETARGKQV